MHAWHGKMLSVDLSAGRVRTEALPEEVLGTWLGGRGLGVRLIADAVALDPFDERMPVVLATGPLCGTAAPASSRLSVVSRSPLTGAVHASSAGGLFPLKLKQAGFDAILITGKAQDPVYLEVGDGRAQLKDAAWLWGKGCIEVSKLFEGSCGTACIGPAGERQVRMANIMFGGASCAGRGGMGALFGAKNLKAVTVDGSSKPSLADRAGFQETCHHVLRFLRDAPAVQGLAEYGTSSLVDVVDRLRMTPTENFRKSRFPLARLYAGPSLRKTFGFRKDGCPDCPVQCKQTTNCGKPIPGYDALSHFGALNANPDAESLIRANILCNNMGLDTVSTAATIAAYGEARGEFLISDDILDLVRKIAFREGEGDALAEGSKRYCASLGRPELSMTVKGLELPACDPRGSAAMALACGTSHRGARRLQAGLAGRDARGAAEAARLSGFDGVAGVVKAAEDANAVADSIAVCTFAFLGASLGEYARLLSAATGLAFTADGLLGTGAEVIGLERACNERIGFTHEDDLLPERFFTEPVTSGEGVDMPPINKARFRRELERYYQLRKETADSRR